MTLFPYQVASNLYLADVMIARRQSFLQNAGTLSNGYITKCNARCCLSDDGRTLDTWRSFSSGQKRATTSRSQCGFYPRTTCLDYCIEESSNDTVDLVLNVLRDLTTAFATDASEQTLDTLGDQLLKTAGNVSRNHFTDLVCRSICKCTKIFGELNSQDQKARGGLQQGFSILCTFYDLDIDVCLDNLTNNKAWNDLCIDVPLATR